MSRPPSHARFPSPRLCRVALALYTLALLAATHWPNLQLPVIVPRTDLWVHAGSFGLWTILFCAARFFGPWRSPRAITPVGAIALVFAVADELTQGIPGINRIVDASDALANALGVALAVAAIFAAALRTRPPGPPRP